MKLEPFEYIQKISPYVPGRTKEIMESEGNFINLASNENPWGVSPKVVRAMRTELSNQHRYPDAFCLQLRDALALKTGLESSEVVVGNGSSELIDLLIKGYTREGDEVISSNPSFSLYQSYVQAHGAINFVVDQTKNFQHDLESIQDCISDKTKLIFLDNPNNPTGSPINPGTLYAFLSDIPETVIVVLDEAYVEFMDSEFQVDIFSLIRNTTGRCGVVILRTFSKLYGLAGLRAGYGLMPAEIAEVLQKLRSPFNVNQMAQVGALAALEDQNYYEKVLKAIRDGREFLMEEIAKLGFQPTPSQANFFQVNLGRDASQLCSALMTEGILVRSLESFGLPESIRVSVGTDKENSKFIKIFANCVKNEKYV